MPWRTGRRPGRIGRSHRLIAGGAPGGADAQQLANGHVLGSYGDRVTVPRGHRGSRGARHAHRYLTAELPGASRLAAPRAGGCQEREASRPPARGSREAPTPPRGWLAASMGLAKGLSGGRHLRLHSPGNSSMPAEGQVRSDRPARHAAVPSGAAATRPLERPQAAMARESRWAPTLRLTRCRALSTVFVSHISCSPTCS